MRLLQSGDTVMVTRLDRIARSTRDLLNTFDFIAVKDAGFRSLAILGQIQLRRTVD